MYRLYSLCWLKGPDFDKHLSSFQMLSTFFNSCLLMHFTQLSHFIFSDQPNNLTPIFLGLPVVHFVTTNETNAINKLNRPQWYKMLILFIQYRILKSQKFTFSNDFEFNIDIFWDPKCWTKIHILQHCAVWPPSNYFCKCYFTLPDNYKLLITGSKAYFLNYGNSEDLLDF